MTSRPFRLPLLVWTGWLFLSLFLHAGPETIRDQVQAGMQTSSAFLLDRLAVLFQTRVDNTHSGSGQRSASAESLQAENRELLRHIAELQKENDQLKQAVPYSPDLDEEMMKLDVVPARIIGRRGDVLSESLELLISLGEKQGIIPGELVLSGQGLLIDRGLAQGLSPDQLLTAGRALFGRTIRVGQQTSLVQPLTDVDFRMAVRIVRRSNLGVVQGPGGILAGTGNGCRLDEVAATEAVAAGDEVYTDRLVSPGAEPIYCGQILSARAETGDNHWTIEMLPLHTPKSLPAKLFVLKTEIQPARAPAHAEIPK